MLLRRYHDRGEKTEVEHEVKQEKESKNAKKRRAKKEEQGED